MPESCIPVKFARDNVPVLPRQKKRAALRHRHRATTGRLERYEGTGDFLGREITSIYFAVIIDAASSWLMAIEPHKCLVQGIRPALHLEMKSERSYFRERGRY